MWHAVTQSRAMAHSPFLDGVKTDAPVFKFSDGAALCADESCLRANAEIAQFAHHFTEAALPQWLPIIYVVANLILNSLNYYWFTQMIDAIMKRFRQEPAGKKRDEVLDPQRELPPDFILDAAEKLRQEQGYFETGDGAELAVPATGVEATEATDSLKQRKPVAS